MSIEEKTTQPVGTVGYTLTQTPRDPYVGLVVMVLLFLVARFGGVPDGMTEEDVTLAVEAVAGGGTVLFGLAAAMWRRRVRRGNVLR